MLQAILVGLIAVIGMFDDILGLSMIGRPIVLGTLVGLVLGDVQQGILIGTTLELAFMGVMIIGIAQSINVIVGGVLGTAFAIITNSGAEVALALAVPAGILYNVLKSGAYLLKQIWVRKVDAAAENGDYKAIERSHYQLFALICVFIFTTVFATVYAGAPAIQALVNAIPASVMTGLSAGTKLLPALGFAMLLNMIWSKEIGAFYFLGFLLASFMNLPTVGVAIIGGVAAAIAYYFVNQNTEAFSLANPDNKSGSGDIEMNSEGRRLLTKKDLLKVFFRSMTLEASFTYERFQGIGYAYSMIPVLKKLYPEKERLVPALKRHIEFFNTTPHVVTSVMGISASMEEEYAMNPDGFEPRSINAIKVGLMGPLAGIGDSLFWGTFRVIAAGIGCQLGLQGSPLAPFAFLIAFNVPHLLVRYYGMMKSYEFGKKFINKISESNLMDKISLSAGILGLTVIGSMTASMVELSTPLVIKFGEIEPIAVQELLDSILPGLLPLCATWIVAILLKKQVKVLPLMYGLLLVGVIGTLIGVL